MGIMKKKLIEEQIEQELELEVVDSTDGEVTFKVVEVDNERKTFPIFMLMKKLRRRSN